MTGRLGFAAFILVLGSLAFNCSCGEGKTGVIKTDKPEKQGFLKVARFEFRLEEANVFAENDPRTIISNGSRILLRKEVLFDNDDLVDAYLGHDEIFDNNNLWLIFSPEAALRLKAVTGQNVGKRLAILVDGEVWIAPRIMQEIPEGRASISGERVQPYIDRLAERLKQGIK